MTWGEWKRWMAAHGVSDGDEISYIDCTEPQSIRRHTSKVTYLPSVPKAERINEGNVTDHGWAIW